MGNRRTDAASTPEKWADARRDIQEKVTEAKDAVQDKSGELKSAVTDGAAKVWGSVKDAGADMKQGAMDDLANARDVAVDYMEQGGEKVREFGAAAEQRIQQQPLGSLAIAAGFGFLIGALWCRR